MSNKKEKDFERLNQLFRLGSEISQTQPSDRPSFLGDVEEQASSEAAPLDQILANIKRDEALAQRIKSSMGELERYEQESGRETDYTTPGAYHYKGKVEPADKKRGVATVGYGVTSTDEGEPIVEGKIYSAEDVKKYKEKHVADRAKNLSKVLDGTKYTDNQLGGLGTYVYRAYGNDLKKFKGSELFNQLKRYERGEATKEDVVAEMLDNITAGGKAERGLVKRVAREAQKFLAEPEADLGEFKAFDTNFLNKFKEKDLAEYVGSIPKTKTEETRQAKRDALLNILRTRGIL